MRDDKKREHGEKTIWQSEVTTDQERRDYMKFSSQ